MNQPQFLFPNLREIQEPVFYLQDGTYTNKSILGVGIKEHLSIHKPIHSVYNTIDSFTNKQGWKIVLLGYDLKNNIEKLTSSNIDHLEFPDLFMVIPEMVFSIEKGEIKTLSGEDHPDFEDILKKIHSPHQQNHDSEKHDLTARVPKREYIQNLEIIKDHLQRGDIYEMNYCVEFYKENTSINAFHIYQKLHSITKAPHSAFIKWNEFSLLCGSPERFISQNRNTLISQPIKGTKRRGTTTEEDIQLMSLLENDPKERSENIMITDLVRNDMSKVSTIGSVEVTELCGIHTFETVHQMISTIQCEVRPEIKFSDIFKSMFPMGSMTGAPKVSAMQIIEKLETTKRAMYSGAVGYIDPDGNFDFNVVIRSLMHNAEKRYLSAMVGGAITIASDPELEYQECLLKAEALFQALQ